MAKILIVEDEAAISNLIKLNLNTAGYEAVQAIDGKKGLNLLKNRILIWCCYILCSLKWTVMNFCPVL
jgi:DNA-binding response OmpR family regulator